MKYRDFIEGVWKGEGIRWFVLFPFLYPLSLLYRMCVELRTVFYKRGILSSHLPPLKVVSIGNITVGGSGKTPLTIYVARLLSLLGYNVAVLSRGYGGKGQERVNIVSDGETICMDPFEAGDEPYLIASKLKGIPVLTGRDRYALAIYAHEHFGSDVVVLDDGFQHLKLRRKLDILLVSHDILFSNYLLPIGRLREPLKAISRADILLLKGEVPTKIKPRILDFGFVISELNPQERWGVRNQQSATKLAFSFTYQPLRLKRINDGEEMRCEDLKDKKILAFSGIADPCSFAATLKDMGAILSDYLVYPDHYIYKMKDVEEIYRKGEGVDFIITTEKDGVKLKRFLPLSLSIHTLEIDISLSNADVFQSVLLGKLKSGKVEKPRHKWQGFFDGKVTVW